MSRSKKPPRKPATDEDFDRVQRYFRKRKRSLERRFGKSLRKAVDELLDPRTGRYAVSKLSKQEKAFIGTKVELLVREEFDFDDGVHLDYSISGVDVDMKYSATDFGWMIPKEAVDQVCLLATLDDIGSTFSVGLFLARPAFLREGENQDKKVTITSTARQKVIWLVRNGQLPENFLLHQPASVVNKVFEPREALQRCVALFENITRTVIPRRAIATVAKTVDPTRRAREAAALIEEKTSGRWRVLRSGGSASTKTLAKKLGVPAPGKGEYISCPP